MSSRTDIAVFCAGLEDDAVERMNAWCAEADRERQQQFERLDENAAGGTKVFTDEIWAMAGNYFPWERLAAAFPAFGWRSPWAAVLIIRDCHDDRAVVVRASDS